MPSRSPSTAIGRWMRKLAVFALVTGGSVTLLGVSLLGALSLPQARASAVARTNGALKEVFAGKIRIERVARMGLTGVSGVDGTVFDRDGHAVLMVHDGTAKLSVIPLVWAAAAHPSEPISVDLTQVSVDHIEVPLLDDGSGSPTLWAAFAPRHPNDGSSNTPPPTINLRSIAVGHAWVHGRLASPPDIDVELEHALAKLEFSAATLHLDLDRASGSDPRSWRVYHGRFLGCPRAEAIRVGRFVGELHRDC